MSSKSVPFQTSIENYCSANRKVFHHKIRKYFTKENDDIKHEKLASSNSSIKYSNIRPFSSSTIEHQMPSPSSNNFDLILMKKKVLTLLKTPCLKFLKQGNCGSHCQHNHYLPSAAVVHETIKSWSFEAIHFLYVTYIQRYLMCHLMYFEVICIAFLERRSTKSLLETVKDCERMALESYFEIILQSLIKCGYTKDEALFEICVNSYRTERSVNAILKIITTLNVVNFERTIAFLSTEIETYDYDPNFGNEILRQACQLDALDVTLLEFCYEIIRKYNNSLNDRYMRELLFKI